VLRDTFNHIADRVTRALGSPYALFLAAAVIVVWALTGPLAGFSDTWQLIINTATTIVTFLMVFVIQNTQNRDGKAVHAKLDELLRASRGARNEFVLSERISEKELDERLEELAALAGMGGEKGSGHTRLHERLVATMGKSHPAHDPPAAAASAGGRSGGGP
jgi:low affinity Fe/Cu permease